VINFNKNSLNQRLHTIFSYALDKAVFPGAAVGISLWNGNQYQRKIDHYGLARMYPQNRKLTPATAFDLASLTKPLATVPALLSLMAKGQLNWEMNLSQIFPGEIGEDKADITIKQLMTHGAGLPSHKDYFKKLITFRDNKKKALFSWIIQEKLQYQPGRDCLYSDLGFLLLGYIIEKISGKNLAEYITEEIYRPINLQDSLFYIDHEPQDQMYAATEICPWTGQILSGRVHDDNCRALGGVAGHAGLFGTIEGVLQWCEYLLSQLKERCTHPAFTNELLKKAVNKEPNSAWTPGFDTPSPSGSSSGRFLSPSAFGHLGFTGTSFWIDPQKELIIILLTNRVHPSRHNELIRQFRPLFHDTILQTLYGSK